MLVCCLLPSVTGSTCRDGFPNYICLDILSSPETDQAFKQQQRQFLMKSKLTFSIRKKKKSLCKAMYQYNIFIDWSLLSEITSLPGFKVILMGFWITAILYNLLLKKLHFPLLFLSSAVWPSAAQLHSLCSPLACSQDSGIFCYL